MSNSTDSNSTEMMVKSIKILTSRGFSKRYYSPFADLTSSYKNCIAPKIDYELWF